MSRVDPPHAADERTMLMSWLEFQRETMLQKIDGLTDEQARWTPAPTANSMLGLITHLANVEHWWFSECFAGNDDDFPKWGDPEDRDYDFKPPPEMSVDEAVALYRRYWERGNEIAASGDMDAVGKHPRGQERGWTLRWILVHMVEETARHAGHADITRELIDGSIGV